MNEPHLSTDDLSGFAARRLDARRVQVVFAHLSSCPHCRDTWQQALETGPSVDRLLDSVSRNEAPARRVPQRRWIAALAAALAILVIGALLLLRRPRPMETPIVVETTPPATTTTAPSTTIASETPPVDPAIEDAFARGALKPPAALAALLATPSFESVRGGETAAKATYEPHREVLATQRPRFRFPAERGVPTVVRVFDRDREVLHSEPVDSGEWTATTDLARGVTYTWQVESTRDGETVIAPAPPAPPARFIVLDAESYRTLQTARREHPDDPLLLGILSARAGLREEAEQELRRSAAESADPRVAALLRSVQNWPR